MIAVKQCDDDTSDRHSETWSGLAGWAVKEVRSDERLLHLRSCCRRLCGCSLIACTTDEPDSNEARGDPEARREEAERFANPPHVANATFRHVLEIQGIAGVILFVRIVDDQTESGEPSERQDDISWPLEEAAREGQKPDETEEDGDSCNDDDVDEARREWSPVQALGVGGDDTCADLKDYKLVFDFL